MKIVIPVRPTCFLSAAWICGGAFALVAVGGCGPKKQAEQAASVVEAARQPRPKVLAYVRLADLIKASPLQADVQRLNDAQKRLLRFDTVRAASGGSPVMAGYVLPPLDGVGSGGSASEQAAQKRRIDARDRLSRNATRNLQTFQNEAFQNTDRRAAQTQSERVAEEEITGAKALSDARQAGERATRDKVAALTEPLTVGRGKNAVLAGQLQPAPNGQDTALPPVLDEAAFEKEIAKLKADPQAVGVSQRARLEFRRRTNQARIDTLEREIRQLVAQGAADIRADVARLRAERLAKIKAEIALLKQNNDVLLLVQSERDALQNTLADESGTAGRAQIAANAQNGSGSGMMAPSVALADMGGSRNTVGSGDVVRARQAALRIQKQREILQALIETDARESIRDNAQTRNVDVVVIEPTVSAKPTAPIGAGRRDMTDDFKRWFLSVGADKNSSNNDGMKSQAEKTARKGRA